jgi:dihydrofolate reductase
MSLKLPNVEAILAVDYCNGLAKNGKIPWKSKTDMMFFKNKTLGHIVIMGSKTLFTLPNAEPLKNRTNVVITSEPEKYSNLYNDFKNNLLFFDFEQTLEFMKSNKNKTIFIIGGNQIYKLLLPYCSIIWLTKMKENYNCDLMFNLYSDIISTYTKEVIYGDSELEIMSLV